MTLFESTLATALRDEAREIAMSTDLNDGLDVLEDRLDDVDRSRRRGYVVGAMVAVAVAAALVAAAVLLRPVSSPPPATHPSPTAEGRGWSSTPSSASTSAFRRPLSLRLPPLLTASSFTDNERSAYVVLAQGQGTCSATTADPCSNGEDAFLAILDPKSIYDPAKAPASSPMPGYAGYVSFIDSLRGPDWTQANRATTTTADGHKVTLWTVGGDGIRNGAAGCNTDIDPIEKCWGTYDATAQPTVSRFAVVDVGATPVVMFMDLNADNPNLPEMVRQFDHMLTTVRFTTP